MLGDLVGERDGERGAATEADDVDVPVARLEIVLEAIHGSAHAFVTAKPERARGRVADSGPRQLADALLIEAAALLGEVVVPQRIVIRVKEIADVGVEGIVNLILVAGSVECVERHVEPLSGR